MTLVSWKAAELHRRWRAKFRYAQKLLSEVQVQPPEVLKGVAVLSVSLGWVENHTYFVTRAKFSPALAHVILFLSGGRSAWKWSGNLFSMALAS